MASSVPASAPVRAPALYISALSAASGTLPFSIRVPCPPAWDDRQPAAWAAERRARRAYFATLDALRTGTVDENEATKIDRLHADLRSRTARDAIDHFRRILDTVRRAPGQSVIPTPEAPLSAVVVTVPLGVRSASEALAARYRWAMEWLDARRFVVGKGLRIEWQVRPFPSPPSVPVVPDFRDRLPV